MVQPISSLPPIQAQEPITGWELIPHEGEKNEVISSSEDLLDGPPLGFEGALHFGETNDKDKPILLLHDHIGKPTRAKKKPRQILTPTRRSKCLEERYPNDRPCYDSSSKSVNKNVKKKLFNQNYLESTDPLTRQQAVELVAKAGVELKEELANKVMQMVHGEGIGMELVLLNEMEAPSLDA